MFCKFIIICLWFVYCFCGTINAAHTPSPLPSSYPSPSLSPSHETSDFNQTRHPKWFPFYTIGRFQNAPCEGKNKLLGTCVLNGECRSSGGISAGPCSSITKQAVCCIYQQTCGSTVSDNNTYFVHPNYPTDMWSGASQTCSIRVEPSGDGICQLRIEFLDFSLAPPNGDGICTTDVISIAGSGTKVPSLCGENAGQHVIVDFVGAFPITITIKATYGYTFGRHWNIRLAQINCNSEYRAPSGCLQYHPNPSGIIRSFNYAPSANSMPNSVGVEGSRQIANLNYGICVAAQSGSCSVTYSPLSSDPYSFTITGDVAGVDPALLGTSTVQNQMCNTDYVIIAAPSQTGTPLTNGSDRFCGLGLRPTTSNVKPYVLYVVTDGNEAMDSGNRGFALAYAQNPCPIILQ